MKRRTSDFDIQAVLAVTWVLSSILLTIALGDKLGVRGWLWLMVHHIVCLLSCAHELRRYRTRQKLKTNQNQASFLHTGDK